MCCVLSVRGKTAGLGALEKKGSKTMSSQVLQEIVIMVVTDLHQTKNQHHPTKSSIGKGTISIQSWVKRLCPGKFIGFSSDWQ